MLYILSGQDDYSLNQALEGIKRQVGDVASLETSTNVLDGKTVSPGEMRTICETVPFLSEKRLVIVHGLLERFGPKNRPRRQTSARKANSEKEKADHKPFAEFMVQVPETTVLVLIENTISNSNPLFKNIANMATARSFPLMKEPRLREWVQKRVNELGGSISPSAANLLARLVGSDLWAMNSEVDKLTLYTSNRKIEEEDINRLVGYTQQANVFTMVDAIMAFKSELAEQLLQRLLQDGAVASYLMAMLARQVRLIVQMKALRNQKMNNQDIQTKLGLNSDFVVRKTLQQASGYSLPRLREIYHSLLETDMAIKTGRYDPELAITILVAELCQRGKMSPVHSPR